MGGEPPIRQQGARVVYENRWMTVREDDVVRADGSTGIFGIVEKPDFALMIPFDGTGFYLAEAYRYPVGGRFVEFPQGSYEESPGVDPVELARGELAEETGLHAGHVEHLGHLFEAYGYSTQGFHVFLATELEHGAQALTVEEADLRVVYLRTARLSDAVLSGRIKDAPTIAAFELLQLRNT